MVRFVKQGKIDAEAAVGGFSAGDGLEEKIYGRALFKCGDLCGDVGQNAALHRDLEALAESVDHAQQTASDGDVVAGGIDADDGVAGAEQETVEDGGGDPQGRVSRVIGLEPCAEAAGQADGGTEAGDHADFGGGGDQVLDAHELADGGCHLRREAGREGGEMGWSCFIGEQPVAEFADGEGADRGEGRRIVGVDDESRDFVGFIGDDLLGEEMREGQIGKGGLGGDAFFGGLRGEAGKDVAAAQGRGLGKEFAQMVEGVANGADGVGKGHALQTSVSEMRWSRRTAYGLPMTRIWKEPGIMGGRGVRIHAGAPGGRAGALAGTAGTGPYSAVMV